MEAAGGAPGGAGQFGTLPPPQALRSDFWDPWPPVVRGWGGDLTAIVLGVLAALIIMNLHMYLFGVAIIG